MPPWVHVKLDCSHRRLDFSPFFGWIGVTDLPYLSHFTWKNFYQGISPHQGKGWSMAVCLTAVQQHRGTASTRRHQLHPGAHASSLLEAVPTLILWDAGRTGPSGACHWDVEKRSLKKDILTSMDGKHPGLFGSECQDLGSEKPQSDHISSIRSGFQILGCASQESHVVNKHQ